MKVWGFLLGWGGTGADPEALRRDLEAAALRRRNNRSLNDEPSMPWGKSWHNRPDCKPPEVLG